jgi:pimeloyl-ACP methyl ester carboxylesterase
MLPLRACSYDFMGVLKHMLGERKLRARLLLIDLLGYGDSDKGVGEARFSIQQHANVLLSVWQR